MNPSHGCGASSSSSSWVTWESPNPTAGRQRYAHIWANAQSNMPASSGTRAPPARTEDQELTEGVDDHQHILWGTVSNSSSEHESGTNSGSSGAKKQKMAARDSSLDGALLVGDNSSSNGSLQSHESLVLNDRLGDEAAKIEEFTTSNFQDKELPLSRAELNFMRRLSRDELSALLPRDHLGNMLSVGSLNHPVGKCSPCALSARAKGCKQDIFCLFCHYNDHPDKKVNKCRPSKNQRLRYRNCLERLEGHMRQTGDIMHEELAESLHRSKTRSAIKTGMGKLSL